jgi:hypothetical protein
VPLLAGTKRARLWSEAEPLIGEWHTRRVYRRWRPARPVVSLSSKEHRAPSGQTASQVSYRASADFRRPGHRIKTHCRDAGHLAVRTWVAKLFARIWRPRHRLSNVLLRHRATSHGYKEGVVEATRRLARADLADHGAGPDAAGVSTRGRRRGRDPLTEVRHEGLVEHPPALPELLVTNSLFDI